MAAMKCGFHENSREGSACPFRALLSSSLPHFPHEPEASDLLERVTKSPPGASAVRVSLSARLALSPSGRLLALYRPSRGVVYHHQDALHDTLARRLEAAPGGAAAS